MALIDERGGIATLAVDRIGVRSIVYQQLGDTLIFGETSDVVLAHPMATGSVSRQARLRLSLLPLHPRTRHDLRGASHRLQAGYCGGSQTAARLSAQLLGARVQRAGFGLCAALQRLPGALRRPSRRSSTGGARLLPERRHRQLHGRRHAGRGDRRAGAHLLDRLRRRRLRRDGVRAHRRAAFRHGSPRVLRDAGRPRATHSRSRRGVRPAVRQRVGGADLLLRALARERRRRPGCSPATAATSSSAATRATRSSSASRCTARCRRRCGTRLSSRCLRACPASRRMPLLRKVASYVEQAQAADAGRATRATTC